MTPALARRGKLILASAITFVLAGAIHLAPPLVGLGSLVIIALLVGYLAFFPTAVLLRRKKIELSWWIPPGERAGGALAAECPFAVHVAFRNHGRRALRILEVTIHATSALEPPTALEAVVPPCQQVEVRATARCHATGYQVLHGAVLTFGDPLGLFYVRAFFPNPMAIKVFPRQMNARGAPLRSTGGAVHDQVGLHSHAASRVSR